MNGGRKRALAPKPQAVSDFSGIGIALLYQMMEDLSMFLWTPTATIELSQDVIIQTVNVRPKQGMLEGLI
jgi:hypothetical protein